MGKKINPSWERKKEELHSPEGVRDLKNELKDALVRRYVGLAESMWRYNFEDFPQFEDMLLMTRDDQPEKTLMLNSQGVWFEMPKTPGQWHFLPFVHNGEVNIYGYNTGWSPVPVGYRDSVDRGRNPVHDMIRDLKLDATNSVIMKDSVYAKSDYSIICKAVDALVDNYLTINQLSVLLRSPFVFRVGPDNILDAKNYFLALAECSSVFFKYDSIEDFQPVVEQTGVSVDPALFDIISKWEDTLLTQLGIESFNTDKKAQQNNLEVSLMAGESEASLRRKEKYRYRKLAIDRLNKMAGTNVQVISVIDSLRDEREMADREEDVEGGEENVDY